MGLLDLFKRNSPGILVSGHHPKLLIDPQGEPPYKGWLDIDLDLSGTHLRFKAPPKSHPNIFSETDQRTYNLLSWALF